ncbi:putative redox protein, regulator of disulfide bond formation [Methylophilaceae bacterium 11]|jgi:TusA-related sulfurtransferase|uniref:sulfurtransferase TusA family protein n=1 Tax=unclassified Methylotenera TaxID=2643294 RepID=UPI00037BE029|nr:MULTISPECIES: sulfurtransferase TusA family protein [unclassified Methylotenera]EUJ11330.1 putative redox protein, regulator of disulfide bond formation [Methylophilaceae bacterium 11]
MEMNYQAQLNLGDADSPIPMIRTKETLDLLSVNDVLKVTVARDSAVQNIRTLISNNSFELLDVTKEADQHVLLIKKL